MKIAFIEIVPMPSCFRQIGVCCVYTYREFALIYCAQFVRIMSDYLFSDFQKWKPFAI